MVVIAPKEPLLVSQDVLDAALAAIDAFCEREGIEATVEVGTYVDQTTGEGPMQRLEVRVLEEPVGGSRRVVGLVTDLPGLLRQAGLYRPATNIVVHVSAEW